MKILAPSRRRTNVDTTFAAAAVIRRVTTNSHGHNKSNSDRSCITTDNAQINSFPRHSAWNQPKRAAFMQIDSFSPESLALSRANTLTPALKTNAFVNCKHRTHCINIQVIIYANFVLPNLVATHYSTEEQIKLSYLCTHLLQRF